MNDYLKDICWGLGAALCLAAIATMLGYVLMSFMCWDWAWNFENHWAGRLWFIFCFLLVCGAIMQAGEDAKKSNAEFNQMLADMKGKANCDNCRLALMGRDETKAVACKDRHRPVNGSCPEYSRRLELFK